MKKPVKRGLFAAAFAALWAASATPAYTQTTAFRFTDLDWRDPHWFAQSPIGCLDVTNIDNFGIKGFNVQLQNLIQTDSDSEGHLEQNYLIIFDPLNQAGAGGTLGFGTDALCTAPLGSTTCSPYFPFPSFTYDNTPASCLGVLAGTTNAAYTPAIVSPTAPCFVSSLGNITLYVMFPLTLRDAYLAATYSGNPATGLVNGMIRGFVTEADANNTIVPFSVDGNQLTLSRYFRGGVSACSQPSPSVGDKDIGPDGASGWYVYLNFTASAVPLVSATPVHDTPLTLLQLDAPAPNPFNPVTTIRYTLPHSGAVLLNVYDATGRRVADITSGSQSAGPHEETWDGRDTLGMPVSSGVYFVRLESAGETRVRKIVLLK